MKDKLSKVSFPRIKRPGNLKVVVLCIFTAATFWIFDALSEEQETSVKYPIEWSFDRESYVVVEDLPDNLQMNVKGLGWNLLRASMGLRLDPLILPLSAPSSQNKIVGASLSNIVAEELDVLELNYIIDDTLRLNIDRKTTRSFAVYVDSANISLADNFEIVSPVRYDVQLIELEGPRRMLEQIPSDRYLVSIPENGIDTDFEEEVEFQIERSDLFSFRPQSMNVSFQVKEYTDAQVNVPITFLDFPESLPYSLQDSVINILFRVQLDEQEQVVADSFAVAVNYNEFNPIDSTFLLRLTASPPFVKNARIEYPQIRALFDE